MLKIPKKVVERFAGTLKGYQGVVADIKARDVLRSGGEAGRGKASPLDTTGVPDARIADVVPPPMPFTWAMTSR